MKEPKQVTEEEFRDEMYSRIDCEPTSGNSDSMVNYAESMNWIKKESALEKWDKYLIGLTTGLEFEKNEFLELAKQAIKELQENKQ